MDEIVEKFKRIPLEARITITVIVHKDPSEMKARLVEYPVQSQDGWWEVKVKLHNQHAVDTFVVGKNLIDVRDGWR